jgi:hypothetical protein
MNSIKIDKRDEVRLLLGKAYNFMKHADKDPGEVTEFYPAANEYVLWDCIDMYSSLVGEVTGIMMAYRAWFYAKNHTILVKTEDQDQFRKIADSTNLNDRNSFLQLASYFEELRTK